MSKYLRLVTFLFFFLFILTLAPSSSQAKVTSIHENSCDGFDISTEEEEIIWVGTTKPETDPSIADYKCKEDDGVPECRARVERDDHNGVVEGSASYDAFCWKPKTAAADLKLTLTPAEVNQGGEVEGVVSGIPGDKDATFLIKLLAPKATESVVQEDFGILIRLENDPVCSASVPTPATPPILIPGSSSGNSKSTTNCELEETKNGVNFYRLRFKISTAHEYFKSNICQPFFLSYNVQEKHTSQPYQFKPFFKIKPADGDCGYFTVTGVTPNPAKPGDTIQVKIQVTKLTDSSYTYEAYIEKKAGNEQWTKSVAPLTCSNTGVTTTTGQLEVRPVSCNLPLILPTNITADKHAVAVKSLKDGEIGVGEVQVLPGDCIPKDQIKITCDSSKYEVTDNAAPCGDNSFTCTDQDGILGSTLELCLDPQGAPFCQNSRTPTSGEAACTADELTTGKCTRTNGIPCDTTTGLPTVQGTGFMTAIGCVPTKPEELIPTLLKVVTAAAGGIALLLMAFGAVGMMLSQGNPESLKKAQEQFTSAVIGLLFIIFSVLLMQIVGVDILNIPGLSTEPTVVENSTTLDSTGDEAGTGENPGGARIGGEGDLR